MSLILIAYLKGYFANGHLLFGEHLFGLRHFNVVPETEYGGAE